MLISLIWHGLILSLTGGICAAQVQTPATDDFIRVHSSVMALEHVIVIDGTGAPAKTDQTLVLSEGKIQAIGNSGSGSDLRLKRGTVHVLADGAFNYFSCGLHKITLLA